MTRSTDSEGVRLQKVMAAAGLGSRRACEQLIEQGRVAVNGKAVREQGMRVDPTSDVITVDGDRIATAPGQTVLAFNKPLGVLSTMSDDQGRPCIGDYVADRVDRLFHVGRLDADTEGLILLTNDGELAQRLSHPRYEVPKTYVVRVKGPVPRDLGKRLKAGIELEDGPVKVDSFDVMQAVGREAMIELTLHEGRNRIIRRMMDEVGHPVTALARIAIGPIALGDLRTGRWRVLGSAELGSLQAAVGM